MQSVIGHYSLLKKIGHGGTSKVMLGQKRQYHQISVDSDSCEETDDTDNSLRPNRSWEAYLYSQMKKRQKTGHDGTKKFAIKIINDNVDQSIVKTEVEAMRNFRNHPNILQIVT